MQHREQDLYGALSRTVWLAAGLFLVFWFLDAIILVMLMFAFALILAMALNPPVNWLEGRKVPRVVGTLMVGLGVVMVIGALGWLVLPRIAGQLEALAASAPDYLASVADRVSDFLADYPGVEERLSADSQDIGRLLPTVQALVSRVGRYSLSLLGMLVLGIAVVSMAVYMVANPRPLLRSFIIAMPPRLREPTARAFSRSSEMVVRWILSNVIVGSIEAMAAVLFLGLIGIPGAIVWGAVAFFAELVPKLGPYLMAIPPIVVAFAVDPRKALWVLVFYVLLNELTGDFVGAGRARVADGPPPRTAHIRGARARKRLRPAGGVDCYSHHGLRKGRLRGVLPGRSAGGRACR